MNIFVITSIINVKHGSIYSTDQRFLQTIETINSIRDRVKKSYIILAEFDFKSLKAAHKNELIKHTDDIYDLTDDPLANMYRTVKSLGDIYCIIKSIQTIKDTFANNFKINSISKISGRYILNENFDIKHLTPKDSITLTIRKIKHEIIGHNLTCYETKFYIFAFFDGRISEEKSVSVPVTSFDTIIGFLKLSLEMVKSGKSIDVENAFYQIYKTGMMKFKVVESSLIGVSGNISPSGEYQSV